MKPINKALLTLSISGLLTVQANATFVDTTLVGSIYNNHPLTDAPTSKEQIGAIAKEAYLYGLPLVFTDFTRQSGKAPNNVFSHGHKFPDHTARLVVAPNNDTNYSTAFLDLGDDAVVLDIPDTKDRYFVVPLMDAWTNVFASFGKRTTGTQPQHYLITGPTWKGAVPAGLKQVKAPTDMVWIIGRIQVNSPEDQVNFVTPIQDQFKLTLLKNWNKADAEIPKTQTTYASTPAVIADVQSRKVNLVQAIKSVSIEDYFNYLNELLTKNPPLSYDTDVLKNFASIGIKPGGKFNLSQFDEATQNELRSVPVRAFAILDSGKTSGLGDLKPVKGAKLGDYKNDYYTRAAVAYKGLGALTPEEATYIGYNEDAEKQILNGQNKYVIHFDAGKLPPATAFWSLTMYGKDRYLVDNPIRRYAIGDRNPLKYNPDGSLDIWVQHDNPGADKENNWLPAPAEEFNVVLRIYVPEKKYLADKKTWLNPPLKKIS